VTACVSRRAAARRSGGPLCVRVVVRPPVARGFSLIELLVATAVTAVILTGAWAWCWSLSGWCATSSERLDAASSLAFARRLTSAELGECQALIADPSVRCSAGSIAFVVPSDDGPEVVTYSYDAARRVLWRKASSSHLAEGVEGFSITYFDAQGRALTPAPDGALPDSDLPLVRRVALRAVVRCASQTRQATWQVCLPPPS
jgi:prepilin-type N-terminal cleavage/methylation domain-containing protein